MNFLRFFFLFFQILLQDSLAGSSEESQNFQQAAKKSRIFGTSSFLVPFWNLFRNSLLLAILIRFLPLTNYLFLIYLSSFIFIIENDEQNLFCRRNNSKVQLARSKTGQSSRDCTHTHTGTDQFASSAVSEPAGLPKCTDGQVALSTQRIHWCPPFRIGEMVVGKQNGAD